MGALEDLYELWTSALSEMKSTSAMIAAKKADDPARAAEALRNASLGMLTPADKKLLQSRKISIRTSRSNKSDGMLERASGGSSGSSSRKSDDDSPLGSCAEEIVDVLEGTCVTTHHHDVNSTRGFHNNAVELREARKRQKLELKSKREEREFQFRQEQAERDMAFKREQAEKVNEFRTMQLHFQQEMIRFFWSPHISNQEQEPTDQEENNQQQQERRQQDPNN